MQALKRGLCPVSLSSMSVMMVQLTSPIIARLLSILQAGGEGTGSTPLDWAARVTWEPPTGRGTGRGSTPLPPPGPSGPCQAPLLLLHPRQLLRLEVLLPPPHPLEGINTHRPGREHLCRGYSLNITECTIQSYFLSVSCIKVFKSHTATGGWGKLWPANAGPLGGRLEVAVWDLKNFIQPTDQSLK